MSSSLRELIYMTLAIVACASLVGAAPSAGGTQAPTHQFLSLGRRQLRTRMYHPKRTFEIISPMDLVGRSPVDYTTMDHLKTNSKKWMENKLGVSGDNLQWNSGFPGKLCQYAYYKQKHDGIPYANAVMNVAFKDGQPVSWGSSWTKSKKIASSKPTISEEDAINAAEDFLDGQKNDAVDVRLEYYATEEDTVQLTYVVQIKNRDTRIIYEAFIDAHDKSLVSATDFSAQATFSAVPSDEASIADAFELAVDPEDFIASPLGWQDDGVEQFTSTNGNNVQAFFDQQEFLVANQTGAEIFNFRFSETLEPSQTENRNLAITNAFTMLNIIHDITYRYGFTEQAFNYQQNNFGKGGIEGDKVLLSVQNTEEVNGQVENNAFFISLPEGQSGICVMKTFTLTKPGRDSALDNTFLIHEMMHGVSNRMTGGGTARCLQSPEGRGMGEGWGDALANWMQQKDEVTTDGSFGAYLRGQTIGFRSHLYSTNPVTNPLKYSDLQTRTVPHEMGEVWANILHNLYDSLVQEHGFSEDAKTNPEAKGGNAIFLHLILDGFLLQPCEPSFVTARDALVAADFARFDGANKCIILNVFASRGLGAGAVSGVFNDDFDSTPECR